MIKYPILFDQIIVKRTVMKIGVENVSRVKDAGCDEKLAFLFNLLFLLFIAIYTTVRYSFYGKNSVLISYANRCTGFYLEVTI